MSLAQALEAHRRGDRDEARRLYDAVLARDPDQADALHLRAVLDHQQGRLDAALAGLERALALAPQLAPAWSNRAALLRDLGRPAEALESAGRALALQPGDPHAANNRAAALLDLGRPAEALPLLQAALVREQGDPSSHHNHGKALLALGRPEAACAAFERALALAPAQAASRTGRAEALAAWGEQRVDAGQGEAGLARLRAALEASPQAPFLFGRWLQAKLRLCDWDGLDAARAEAAQAIAAGASRLAPFVALHLPLSRAQQRACARIFSARIAPRAADRPPPAPPAADGRLRVGFFSADFREHPTARLMAGMIEQLPRARIEAFGFAFGPPSDDTLRRRLRAAFEHFEDVAALDDGALVQRARACALDIAIDLGGPTRDARPGLFARRLAPLQAGWLGFAGTQGAPWFDALIADAVVAPPEHAADYDEAIVCLPHSYQPNDARRVCPPAPPRAQAGLPDGVFVWAALHGPAKLEPGVWAVWMRLLRARPGSVLWLLRHDDAAVRRLQAAASTHGVDPARLFFAPPAGPAQHLARLACADLALDTFVYNGHTTTSDALWAGLPVLSCRGQTFPARVAASLLQAAGLPELVAPDAAAYEALALELSAPGSRLADLRARLAAQRAGCALFDDARFARAFEAALSALWRRQRAGRPRVGLQVLEDAGGHLRVVEQPAVAQPAGADQTPGRQ